VSIRKLEKDLMQPPARTGVVERGFPSVEPLSRQVNLACCMIRWHNQCSLFCLEVIGIFNDPLIHLHVMVSQG
jgi:hypothetical protein